MLHCTRCPALNTSWLPPLGAFTHSCARLYKAYEGGDPSHLQTLNLAGKGAPAAGGVLGRDGLVQGKSLGGGLP